MLLINLTGQLEGESEVIDPVSSGPDTDGFEPSFENEDDDNDRLTADISDENADVPKQKSKGTRKMRGLAVRQSVKDARGKHVQDISESSIATDKSTLGAKKRKTPDTERGGSHKLQVTLSCFPRIMVSLTTVVDHGQPPQ
jgi:hypothetical protein